MNFPNISALAVKERAVTLFLIIAIILAGTFAFLKLGRGEDPPFTIKIMVVTAVWPGATAEQMDTQVANPIQKRLQELRYYDRVESVARPGVVQMKVYLRDSTPPSAVPGEFYQVRKKLLDVTSQLPSGVIGPFANDEFSDSYFAIYALQAKGLPQPYTVAQAEDLRLGLLRLPGVQKVRILGETPQVMYIDLDNQKLANLSVKPVDIANALRASSQVTPSGFVEAKNARLYVRLDDDAQTDEKLAQTPIKVAGQLIKVSGIGTVRHEVQDPPDTLIRHNGQPSVLVGVVMAPRFNGLDLGKSLDAWEKTTTKDLPAGITMSRVSSRAHVIAHAIDEFTLKFVVALSVVMIVSLLALGFRVGLVVAAAVPLTLAAVFVIMLFTGKDFDRITLGALILSLGLLVDDAIIAIEMMVVKLEEGLTRIEAATFAWRVTAAPMLSGTLVTILGFIPVGFAQSSAGEYAGNIFWIVAFSLLVSWVVAVTFTPYLGVVMLPKIKPKPGGHDAIYATKNYQALRRTVQWIVKHKRLGVGVTVAIFAVAIVGMGFVTQQFFPTSDQTELSVEVYTPPGSPIGAPDAVIKRLESRLKSQPEVKGVTSYVGQGSARFFVALNTELPNPAYGQMIIQTGSPKERDALKGRLRQWARDGLFPEAEIRVTQFTFGPPVPYDVMFRVVGPDADQVRSIAERVRTIMAANPHMRYTKVDWGDQSLTAKLRYDDDRLRQLGLTPESVALQVQGKLSGFDAVQLRLGTRIVPVRLRVPEAQRDDPSSLAALNVVNDQGVSIPLGNIAKIETSSEPQEIKRYSGELYIAVEGDVIDGLQPPDVNGEILPKLSALKASLPAGYRVDTGGAVEESAKANVALVAVMPIMVVLTFLVLMLQVRSFSTMFMVYATAPLGIVGAVPALLISHQPFGFTAILGLIGLSGILMRNTLILVEQIKADKAAGLSDYQAVVESTVRRARPVILTAVAAMLAFIPLTTSVFWGALAWVLIGGVGMGTLLTLLFLPALYSLWFKVKPESSTAETGNTHA